MRRGDHAAFHRRRVEGRGVGSGGLEAVVGLDAGVEGEGKGPVALRVPRDHPNGHCLLQSGRAHVNAGLDHLGEGNAGGGAGGAEPLVDGGVGAEGLREDVAVAPEVRQQLRAALAPEARQGRGPEAGPGDGLAFAERLLQLHHVPATADQGVHDVDLGGAQAQGAGELPGGGVRVPHAAGGELQPAAELLEVAGAAQVRYPHGHGRAHARAEVRGAGGDEPQPLVPHEALALLCKLGLQSLVRSDEPREGLRDAGAFLHHQKPEVVLFIDPRCKVSLLVCEDAPCVRPVPSHARRQQHG
mmetsp:Transcript_90148/g.218563  ORF Transcript_90148/g.218563 Transcript_90148/m.218563 type:complete len:300 (-) Transcript_90148:958-1857(-)